MSALRLILPLLCGALFGAGLLVAGMTDPAKVRGFLDPFGAWDPTLAFVMGGAVVVAFIGYRLVLALQQRWNGQLIDRSDGLFMLFERPIDALGFALDYQRGLQPLGQGRGTPE